MYLEVKFNFKNISQNKFFDPRPDGRLETKIDQIDLCHMHHRYRAMVYGDLYQKGFTDT